MTRIGKNGKRYPVKTQQRRGISKEIMAALNRGETVTSRSQFDGWNSLQIASGFGNLLRTGKIKRIKPGIPGRYGEPAVYGVRL